MTEQPEGSQERGGWLPPAPPGAAPPPPPPRGGPASGPEQHPNTEGAVSIGLGSLGVVLLWASNGLLCVVALPLGVAGWILGAKARGRIRRGETRRQFATAEAGWVVGIGVTVLSAVTLAVLIVLLATGHHHWLGRHI